MVEQSEDRFVHQAGPRVFSDRFPDALAHYTQLIVKTSAIFFARDLVVTLSSTSLEFVRLVTVVMYSILPLAHR
jgi:hypothetical protein